MYAGIFVDTHCAWGSPNVAFLSPSIDIWICGQVEFIRIIFLTYLNKLECLQRI